MFERYVNFEFYKTTKSKACPYFAFERYVNFEFYKTNEPAQYHKFSLRDM